MIAFGKLMSKLENENIQEIEPGIYQQRNFEHRKHQYTRHGIREQNKKGLVNHSSDIGKCR